MTLAPYASLLRWLGPWTSSDAQPASIARETIAFDDLEAWLYRPPGRPIGTYFVVQGLHFAGPADVRLDRFCRVLAAAGFLVFAPFLPTYLSLRVEDSVIDEVERAFEACVTLPGRPPGAPGVFSISFGSMPALRLAASAKYRDQIRALVLFGGYADFERTVRFVLGVDSDATNRDPLNAPAVLIGLIDEMDRGGADPDRLRAAWRSFLEQTWGSEAMKAPERYEPIAKQIAETLPESERALFLTGCNVQPGLWALVEDALTAAMRNRPCLDPRSHLGSIRCDVHVVHGVDDDVIPHTELDTLVAALPSAANPRGYKTGLYAHTGVSLSALRDVGTEVVTLVRMLRAIVNSGKS